MTLVSWLTASSRSYLHAARSARRCGVLSMGPRTPACLVRAGQRSAWQGWVHIRSNMAGAHTQAGLGVAELKGLIAVVAWWEKTLGAPIGDGGVLIYMGAHLTHAIANCCLY